MAEMIDVKNMSKSLDEKAEILRSGQNIICECENNGLRAVILQTANGIYYAVMLSATDTGNATFKRTASKDKALKVFDELKAHILNADRNYQELCGILNSRL